MDKKSSNDPDGEIDGATGLLTYHEELRLQHQGAHTHIWDAIRKRYVLLQPEELVRQLLIIALTRQCGVGVGRMQIEKSLGSPGRYDLMVYNRQGQAALLAECKSFRHKLQHKDIMQIARYNDTINAPILLLTNGSALLWWDTAHADSLHQDLAQLSL